MSSKRPRPPTGTMSSLKIALYHNLPSGGARRAMVEIVKGLVAHGHTMDEWCPETADLTFLPLDGIVRRTEILPLRLRGVAPMRVPLLTPYLTAARLATDLRTMAALGRKVAESIDRQGYDVIFTHDCQLVLVPDVLQFLQLPSAHYFHAGTRSFTSHGTNKASAVDMKDKIKAAYYAPAHRHFPSLRFRQAGQNLHAARKVLTNSKFAAAELNEAFGIAADVCYLGVDTACFRPMGLPRERFVLSVGAVHPHKGYRFLIESLARLPERRRPPLVIAANSSEPAELQAIQTLAANRDVALTVQSVRNAEEMAALYNCAPVFVYCPVREPWGLAAVEAMACGTPVVAVSEGGVAESCVHGETGLLVERDEAAFADALNRVLSDPALGAQLGAGGVVRVQTRFTWDRTVEEIEKHLSAITRAGMSR